MGMTVSTEGAIFHTNPEPLADLLAGIHTHKTALPNFQRPWVWAPQMVRELLISVAYRYPAGSLLTMPVTSAGFALRPFEGAGEALRVQPTLMVLDGQQRLTSLYQALYRHDGVTVKGRTFYFYLDVRLLMDEDAGKSLDDRTFADALFYVQQEKNGRRVRYEGLQPRYELTKREHELDAGALPLHHLFDAGGELARWKQDYLVQLSSGDMPHFLALNTEWDRRVQPWLDHIRGYPFPVVELNADMPLGAICHIFEKVNSTGVPLDVFDLCTAILWAQGLALNEEWAKARKQCDQAHILPMQPKPLEGTPFLQALSLLDSIERKRSSRPGERIAVACRKEDLMALDAETVRRWWPVLIEGYREASKFMTAEGMLDKRILPYTTLIIPLSAIFADLRRRKGEAHVGTYWSKISRWYWCSVFSQRYSSQVEYASAQDFEQVISWCEGGDPPEVVRTFSFRSDVLQEVSSIRNAIYKGVLCLLARTHARDFGGAGDLSVALFHDLQQDHHHIFPLDALKQMGIADTRADAIVNKTLISAAVNRSIGGRPPADYVRTWRGKLGPQQFDDILRSHAIDPALLEANDWNAFVLGRRERLRGLIEEACGGSVHAFGDDTGGAAYPEVFDGEDEDQEGIGA